MFFIEMIGGIILLVLAFFILRAASPKNGVSPPYMQVTGMKELASFSCLLAICTGGTLIIHSILTV